MTGVTVVDRSTGEIVESAAFDMATYVASVSTPEAFQRQQALAAAYDHACRSLIGPNDVQQEGGRTFKCKSAWRKLGRHFNISTEVLRSEREWLKDDFLATVTVRAVAPWGQYTDAVGACCTDEESGRRTITVADAIATAETRATNRAISNLIAMGEVSAEEMGKGRPASKSPADKLMPFGKHKDKRLADVPVVDLRSTVQWCKEKDADKFKDLIAACESVIASKGVPGDADEGPDYEVDEPA